MTVTKAVVRGILIAGLAISPARAGSMLVLGLSSNSGDASTASNASASFSSFSIAPSSPAPVAALRLGLVSDTNTSAFIPYTVPAPVVATIPAPAPQPIAPPALPFSYDAVLNLGSGPYPNAGSLTTGNAQPWYLSAQVFNLYGGVPNLQQRADFANTIYQRVQQSFGVSGVPISLTTDSNASAAHTLSVVSQATNPSMGSAIGMTYLGGNGFHYIDNSARSAASVDQLEWIVAHNVAHELMLAFHVPENYDKTGKYLDATNANWLMMTSPNAQFSPAAVSALLARDFQATETSVLYPSAQLLGPSPVPEPASMLLWGLLGGTVVVARRSLLAKR